MNFGLFELSCIKHTNSNDMFIHKFLSICSVEFRNPKTKECRTRSSAVTRIVDSTILVFSDLQGWTDDNHANSLTVT